MKILLGGVRGTSAVSDPVFMGYGGETTAFLVEGKEGTTIVVDAGTGVRVLDAHLRQNSPAKSLLLLMTHYHFDHVAGFPSFSILYDPAWSLEVAAPRRNDFAVREVVSSLMAKPFWPLQIEALHATIRFRTLPEETSQEPYLCGGLAVRWCPVHHLGGCSAYRIDEPATGASVVVATDVEWAESTEDEREALLDLCAVPNVTQCLLFDGHFAPAVYPRFKGWGHSTWADGVEIAREAGVERLLITHHAPDATDTALEALEKECGKAFPGAVFARQGMRIELPG
ncbi:MAG: MBL fold metallo-hydrolase [Kiritimatiellae bacterium]|nr:MBL fold metallo-hydrolase [Kiritimatiellia bacterium]